MNVENEEREEIEAPVAESEGGIDDIGVDNAKEFQDDSGPSEDAHNKKVHMKVAADAPWSARMWEVFSTFWPLGLIAFGGPQVCYTLFDLVEFLSLRFVF